MKNKLIKQIENPKQRRMLYELRDRLSKKDRVNKSRMKKDYERNQ